MRGVAVSCRCRPPCWRRSIRRWAARRRSTIRSGKNMVGAFYQPLLVLSPISGRWTTLPDTRGLSAGLGGRSSSTVRSTTMGFLRLDRSAHRRPACTRRCGGAGTTPFKPLVAKSRPRWSGQDEREIRPARDPQFRPHLRACDRIGPRLRRVAAWRGRRLRHGDGGAAVGAAGRGRCRLLKVASAHGVDRTRRPADPGAPALGDGALSRR